MVGDGRVRFCGDCGKNVYNLSAMMREDAEALLRETEGASICVRMFRRADGTMLTADCPIGARKVRRRRAALATAGAGIVAVATAVQAVPALAHRGESAPRTSTEERMKPITQDMQVRLNFEAPRPPEPRGQWHTGVIAWRGGGPGACKPGSKDPLCGD
jgi:hypothetical protein